MKRTRFVKISSLFLAIVLIAAMALIFAGCNKNSQPDGGKAFTFICTDADGNQQKHDIKSNAASVGEALIEEGLIAGEEGPYGLYVKEVCGITADYDTDKTYWSFYINGEYAMQGVEKTDITDGATYEFKIEK